MIKNRFFGLALTGLLASACGNGGEEGEGEVDECATGDNNCTPSTTGGTCTDTKEGFTCGCQDGYDLDDDGYTCTKSKGCTKDEECGDNASCDPKYGCSCNDGFFRNLKTKECDKAPGPCDGTPCGNGDCVKDGKGGYDCDCDDGHVSVEKDYGETCVDACADVDCPPNEVCDSFAGGQCFCDPPFESVGEDCVCPENQEEDGAGGCVCSPGFNDDDDDGDCDDDEECAACDVASTTCENGVGSTEANCVCIAGYHPGDVLTACDDDDECAGEGSGNNCDTNATCTNSDGSFSCACNEGYEGDGTVCANINECTAETDDCTGNEVCDDTDGSFTCTHVLIGPSKSGTVAITDDDAYVVMVNPEDDSISIFETDGNTRTAKVDTGDEGGERFEPSAVVIHPDGVTAFVANRAAATVVKVTGIDTDTPEVSDPLAVGSEPTGLALSPTGATLFVAEFAEGHVSIVDTETMTMVNAIDPSGESHPRTIAVTNDGDTDDTDELLILPEFYGTRHPDQTQPEANDQGRQGKIRIYDTLGFVGQTAIKPEPIQTTFVPGDVDGDGFDDVTGAAVILPAVMTSPNQFYSVAISGSRIYVTSISASPQAPIKFNTNVQPVVFVGELGTDLDGDSVFDGRGNVMDVLGGTTNLAELVNGAIPTPDPVTGFPSKRFFLADLVDIVFSPGEGPGVAYALSRGADVLQRVTFDNTAGVSIGAGDALPTQIDLNSACNLPTGVAVNSTGSHAYVNCWFSRKLAVVNLATQELSTAVEASDPATDDDAVVNKGRKFYFTGRGRWSKAGWSSCGSCHPDGLSDNITWVFPAGPRQTTSMDGTFSHSSASGEQEQRILNWTGIFDEIHDFERNTRDVSNGTGAITTDATAACNGLQTADEDSDGNAGSETRQTLPGNMNQPVKELEATTNNCKTDFDDMEEFIKTIRPPKALQLGEAASIANGAVVFETVGCNKCHGGVGWTVSRVFWERNSTNNDCLSNSTTGEDFTRPEAWPVRWDNATTRKQISNAAEGGPNEVACVIRDLETFGVPGDDPATTPLEKKNGADPSALSTAQGAGGYNIPSLYGLALGAPYLHHGQAASLSELLTDTKWAEHAGAGIEDDLTTEDVDETGRALTTDEVSALVDFLLSIDTDTAEISAPEAQENSCVTTCE